MDPKPEPQDVRVAMRWPEPTSLVFVLDNTLRDVDALDTLRAVVQENGGTLEESAVPYKSDETRALVEASEPEVYRADFKYLKSVTEVVNTFHGVDRSLKREGADGTVIVRQINWHTGSTPCVSGNGSGGGPGARPAPFAQFMQRAPENDSATIQMASPVADANVRLVIFDAWNGDNTETQRLVDFATDDSALLYFLNQYPDDSTFDPRLDSYGASRDGDPFPMPDHGLFVAYMAARTIGWDHLSLHSSILERANGTVHTTSSGYNPNKVLDRKGAVTLQSVKVLGEYGVGDTYQLIQQLERIAASRQRNEHLIINLSLVINTPNPRFAMRQLFDNDRREEVDLHAALHQVIHKLHRRGVLLVAAAGNSSAGEASRQRALFPAAFDEVLGVTAALPDGSKEAYYANRVFSKGLATFGGTVKKDSASGHIVVDDRYPLDGYFTNSTVPIYGDDPNNDSGAVLWAGTSFATPRIAGLAARIWANNPNLTNDEVRDKVWAMASRTLQCGTPFVAL